MEAPYDPANEGVDATCVTVVVPCFNAAAYLPATLASIEGQTAQGFQVLLFDDGSVDATHEVAAMWAATTPGSRAVRRNENRGVCRTLNEALELVTTEFTIIFGADDVMLPTLVADAVTAIRALPQDYAAIAFPHIIGDEEGRPVLDDRGVPAVMLLPDGVAAAEPGDLLPLLVIANRFAGVALFRTQVLRSLGFDESLHIEDWDLWCRLTAAHRIGALHQPVFVYRNSTASLDKRLRANGRRYVDAAALRAKWVGRDASMDTAIAHRTRTDLHILLVAGLRAEAAAVLRLLDRAGLAARFRSERWMLRVPSRFLRPALALPERLRGWLRR